MALVEMSVVEQHYRAVLAVQADVVQGDAMVVEGWGPVWGVAPKRALVAAAVS